MSPLERLASLVARCIDATLAAVQALVVAIFRAAERSQR